MVEPSAGVLILQVLPDRDEDLEQLDARRASGTRHGRGGAGDARSSAGGRKGVVAALGGWLAIHFGPAGLKAVVNAVVAWAGRTGKTVEITLNGNTVKLTGTSADVQSRIIDEFFVRQSPPA
jgi:hypothetical protein